MLNIYTALLLFVWRGINCHLSVSTLSGKFISATLFVFYFSLNTLFLPFVASFTCKCLKHSYLLEVYILTRDQEHLISLFKTAENVTFTFHALLSPSTRQSYLYSSLRTSKYLRRYLGSSLFGSKYVYCVVFPNLTFNSMTGTYLVAL